MINTILSFLVFLFPFSIWDLDLFECFTEIRKSEFAWTLGYVKLEECFIKMTSSLSCKLDHQQDFWLPATGTRALSKSNLNLSTAVPRFCLQKNLNIWTRQIFRDKPRPLYAEAHRSLVYCIPFMIIFFQVDSDIF